MEYRIGEVAERVGMTAEGVRYYERRGLLPRPRRSSSGYRLYSDADLRRLAFIKAAQEMGFSLREVEELLALRGGDGGSCAAVRERLAAKLEEVRRRRRLLGALERDLKDGLRRCEDLLRAGEPDSCPVLEELESGALAATLEEQPLG